MAGCQDDLLNSRRFSNLSFVHSGTKEDFISIWGQGKRKESGVLKREG